mmetsp:Transcript_17206/g.35757  ORF Transcript_17206/g.35757 Transcript_17206/m.35757 type:complete len:209 (-) Transcript_17206:305-931(-)
MPATEAANNSSSREAFPGDGVNRAVSGPSSSSGSIAAVVESSSSCSICRAAEAGSGTLSSEGVLSSRSDAMESSNGKFLREAKGASPLASFFGWQSIDGEASGSGMFISGPFLELFLALRRSRPTRASRSPLRLLENAFPGLDSNSRSDRVTYFDEYEFTESNHDLNSFPSLAPTKLRSGATPFLPNFPRPSTTSFEIPPHGRERVSR